MMIKTNQESLQWIIFIYFENLILGMAWIAYLLDFYPYVSLLIGTLCWIMKLTRLSADDILTFFLPSVLFFHGLAWALGAPILSDQIPNLLFSTFCAGACVAPLLPNFRAPSRPIFVQSVLEHLFHTPLSHYAIASLAGALGGAWSGSFFYPLDWDRPWQVWPIPTIACSLLGSFLLIIISFGYHLIHS